MKVAETAGTDLAVLLARAQRRIERALAEVYADFDVTAEQWRILSVLLDEPGQTMTRLADAAALPAGTLTRHVDRLAERGLVLRKVHPEDKRRAVVALSPVGASVAREIRARQQTEPVVDVVRDLRAVLDRLV
ncbi:MarR family winged helix-turn-helix transcriptional regulator [Nocardioides luteus]|uniref:MarR family winged helix-turn-helix transcriptional regulator n=1 Tax=Nocardioides luteus TaxID=1844 RepID=UPI0018C9C7FC|nr:MarR family transcriptional regulator [Nocardioides luteus]MBG6095692.1 DNA-binding MarR family transcriptional regulator [Nocardioides luteus]